MLRKKKGLQHAWRVRPALWLQELRRVRAWKPTWRVRSALWLPKEEKKKKKDSKISISPGHNWRTLVSLHSYILSFSLFPILGHCKSCINALLPLWLLNVFLYNQLSDYNFEHNCFQNYSMHVGSHKFNCSWHSCVPRLFLSTQFSDRLLIW